MAMVQGENLVVLRHDELLARMVELNGGLNDPRLLAEWIRVNDMSHTVRGSEALHRPEPPAPGSPGRGYPTSLREARQDA